MSWGLGIAQTKPADVEDALRKAKQAQLDQQPFDSWDDDVETDMEAAIHGVSKVAKTMDEEYVNVSLSGHRRRGETDASSFTISLYGALPPAKAKK